MLHIIQCVIHILEHQTAIVQELVDSVLSIQLVDSENRCLTGLYLYKVHWISMDINLA